MQYIQIKFNRQTHFNRFIIFKIDIEIVRSLVVTAIFGESHLNIVNFLPLWV